VTPALTIVRLLVPLLLLGLAACTSDGGRPDEDRAGPTPSASPSATLTMPPREPRVGECRLLTLDDASRTSSDADPVPCRQRHTAVTILVGQIVFVGGDPQDEAAPVDPEVPARCRRSASRFLGGDPETMTLSRFQVVWFTPTAEEQEAGAGWFHCDVLALDRGDRLLPLPPPERLRGILGRPEALATYGLCGTAAPGEPGFERVACARRHTWVAIGTIPLEGGRRYPGTAAVRRAGDEPCAVLVREEKGFPVEFRYGWEWPTAEQWAAGQRHGFCWAPA
jgi:hypothetical protein